MTRYGPVLGCVRVRSLRVLRALIHHRRHVRDADKTQERACRSSDSWQRNCERGAASSTSSALLRPPRILFRQPHSYVAKH